MKEPLAAILLCRRLAFERALLDLGKARLACGQAFLEAEAAEAVRRTLQEKADCGYRHLLRADSGWMVLLAHRCNEALVARLRLAEDSVKEAAKHLDRRRRELASLQAVLAMARARKEAVVRLSTMRRMAAEQSGESRHEEEAADFAQEHACPDFRHDVR